MSAEDRVWFFKLGDRLWHSDSFVPAGAGEVFDPLGRVIPLGAKHRVRRMRAAYDALDERTQGRNRDLVCEHSLKYSREAIGFPI